MKKKKNFAKKLINYRKRIHSQTIEDGIIEGIFDNIGTTNKYFIEFGAWDGVKLSNTANLRINEGWDGLLLEGNKQKADKLDYIKHAFLTAENVNQHFENNNVPKTYDLLSIDLDGNDYWIWKAIDETKFKARVVVVEFNCNIPDQTESIAIKYSPELDTTVPSINYYGASISAFKKLGELKGYSLIFRVNNHNLFFVDTNLLHEEDINIPLEMFLNKEISYKQDRKDKNANELKNVFNYDKKLLHDVFYGEDMIPHWNEYADTSINIWWPQRFDKEWIKV
jgi:hypothetical protein